MNPAQNDEVMNFFKTFTQADRLKIAGLLGLEAMTLDEIAEQLKLRAAAASSHLSYLENLGYVQREGNRYRLNVRMLEDLAKRVLAGQRPKVNADELISETEPGSVDYEHKVLSDFLLPDGRLKSLPAQQKKLIVILSYVARSFESGARYPEKEVNERLSRFYKDTASLRRYLVDFQLLQREKGIYWKPDPADVNAES